MCVVTNSAYGDTWFGEGEVKMVLDGDKEFPTQVGTGIEDYVGTAYGQGTFSHNYQGYLIANNKEKVICFLPVADS